MGLKITYSTTLYPPVENTEHCIQVINEWQDNFTSGSHMQPELVKLYHICPDAFYLYADTDWYSYNFTRYKTLHANMYIDGLIKEGEADNVRGRLDTLRLFELVNLPMVRKFDYESKLAGRRSLIMFQNDIAKKRDYTIFADGKQYSLYGNRDLGRLIDKSEWAFSEQWAWQQDWYKNHCQISNTHNLSTDKIETIWLEFAHKHGLISHKSPSPRRVDWVY